MGHYYSEMACSDCGRIPCKCKRAVDMTHAMWLVDPADLQVMQVFQFDRKYRYVQGRGGIPVLPGNPESRRFGSKLFATEAEASAHRPAVLDGQIERLRKKMADDILQLEVLQLRREKLDDEQ